jgi:hypothetical protein
MVRVLALVEGKTERLFGQQVIAPHLGYRGVSFHPREIGAAGHKGGVGPWPRALREIVNLIRQEPGSVVTTMFDLYALPNSWPGREESVARGLKHDTAVAFIESKINDAVRAELAGASFEPRFVPYLSLHEYEALLFSDPVALASVTRGPGDAEAFQAVLAGCGACEKINDHPTTAPSKRILKIAPAYAKTVDGVAAAERMGLEVIRRRCPHFAAWLARLEQLS